MNRVYGLFQKDLRNRSSKDLMLIQKVKPTVRSVSNEALDRMVANGDAEAVKERARRQKKRDKKAAKAS